jgi:hypothetical protein
MDTKWNLLKVYLTNKAKGNAMYRTFCNSILNKMKLYDTDELTEDLHDLRWAIITNFVLSKQTDKNRTIMSNVILEEMKLIYKI